ncbi:uncharacterized protein LOC128657080 isoform X1 [Bombina bombina]|uniref:uncharacterized protein LOC128657080 isoform X1 n=1 Tax=Bombina bombina TaxID=8345 RepID=UPI00235A74EA|nr:uncharacterized protein LOC128657080 isoform X1 [Bombina bombina]
MDSEYYLSRAPNRIQSKTSCEKIFSLTHPKKSSKGSGFSEVCFRSGTFRGNHTSSVSGTGSGVLFKSIHCPKERKFIFESLCKSANFQSGDYRDYSAFCSARALYVHDRLTGCISKYSIHPDHYQFLRFSFLDKHYQFVALPFCLATAPIIFSKVFCALLSVIREWGIAVFPYLDDILILAQSLHSAESHTNQLVLFIHRHGWRINLPKSYLITQTRVIFLGFQIDSVSMTLSLTDKRRLKLVSACQNLFSQIVQMWGLPEIDLMASHLNKKLPRYLFRSRDHQAEAVDALAVPWCYQPAYIFPPLVLLPRVISKIIMEQSFVLLASQVLVCGSCLDVQLPTLATSIKARPSVSRPVFPSGSQIIKFEGIEMNALCLVIEVSLTQ